MMLKSVIDSRFEKPNHWQWDYFNDPDKSDSGHRIRYGFCKVANPKAIAIIAPGRSEPAELYFETIHDLLDRQFSVAIIDWQGQGGSYRYNDDNTRHDSMGFEHDVADFGNFLNLINKTMGQSPKCLIAHSMGGHFSLKFIEKNPNYFDCAIMIAPMFGVNLPPFLKPVANLIASASQSTNHMPGMQSWTPEFHEEKVRDVITSDPMRGNLIPFYYSKNEELECGGVTCRWYTEALKSNRELIDSDLSEINTPILFVLAEREQVVDNEAVKKIAIKIENGELCTIGLSQHGIHLEIDMIRNQLWEKIDRFTQKHLHFKPNA